MEDLPPSVARRLEALIRAERRTAWLEIDAGLALAGAGGDLAHWGLDELCRGAPATEAAPFLEGLLPPAESPYHLPLIEIGKGRVADLHFHAEADKVFVILLDVAGERDATRRVQQKAYDMTLLQERETQLNRRLEAANAALQESQRELERANEQVWAQAAELAAWNCSLEELVEAQLGGAVETPTARSW
jgi:adenylate cyclase